MWGAGTLTHNIIFLYMIFQKLKIQTLISLLLILLILFGCSDNNDKSQKVNVITKSGDKISLADKKIFGLKSGIIYYDVTGDQVGTKKLYFDDWGRKQAEFSYTTIKVGKYSKSSSILKIINNDLQYIIDLKKKYGTKRKNPVLDKLAELSRQMNYNEFGEQLILFDGGVEAGHDSVAGKYCTIYDFKTRHLKEYIWKWITLKSISHSGGVDIITTANKIEENTELPDSLFLPPKDVAITEVDFGNIKEKQQGENF